MHVYIHIYILYIFTSICVYTHHHFILKGRPRSLMKSQDLTLPWTMAANSGLITPIGPKTSQNIPVSHALENKPRDQWPRYLYIWIES